MFFWAGVAVLLFFLQKEKLKVTGFVVAFLALYAVSCAGLLHSSNVSQGVTDVGRKVAFIIFPILLTVSPKPSAQQTQTVLLTFVLSCIMTCVFCLSVASYRLLTGADSSFLSYHALSEVANMRANYLSLHLCIAVAIVFYFINMSKTSSMHRVIFYVAIAILIVSMLLLSARMQIILLTLAAMFYGVSRLRNKFGVVTSIVGGILIGILVTGLIFIFPANRERFKEAINYNKHQWGEQQIRGSIWPCSIELIKENPLFGVGTGDGIDELEKCYKRNDYTSLLYWEGVRFNAHNQFLETTIELGIVGLLFLVALFFVCLRNALSNENRLFLLFILIFAVCCLTESFLERQKGIVFFAFFSSFLCVAKPEGAARVISLKKP